MKKKKVVLVIVETIAVIFLAYESVMHIMYLSYMRRRRNGLCSVQEMLGWLYRLS